MKILLTGATGFIGTPLVARLADAGHECTLLTRQPRPLLRDRENVRHVPYDDIDSVREVEVVINLAGESVGGRWKVEKKQRIYRSRIGCTQTLVRWMSKLVVVPRVFLSGSAVGIYGHQPRVVLDEDSLLDPRSRFRYQVCQAWEREASAAAAFGTRTVLLRLGNVIDPSGGLVGTVLPILRSFPFLLPIAPSRKFSWIALPDAVRLIEFAMDEPSIEGPLNVVAPHSSDLGTLTRELGRLARRPAFASLPAVAARLALGEMGQAITDDQDVRPAKALAYGFRFECSDLGQAMR